MKKYKLSVKGRVTNASLYFDIAQDNYHDYLSLKTEFRKGPIWENPDIPESDIRMMNEYLINVQDEIQVSPPFSELLQDALENKQNIEKRRIQAIVFAHFCLEAFIYDYAIYALGERFTKKYVERMPFLSKWLFIPNYCMGMTFNKERSKGWELLTRLNTERNNHVHCKSKTTEQYGVEVRQTLEQSLQGKEQQEDVDPILSMVTIFNELRELQEEAVKTKHVEVLNWNVLEAGFGYDVDRGGVGKEV